MGLNQKLVRAWREIPAEANRLRRHQYPRFVTSRKPARLQQEVPVFMFHTVARSTFEAQLLFLRRNGYRTLDLPTFLAFLRGEHVLTEPSVMLTFDDGHQSWYDVAFPLLRQHGFHGVGFLVPTFVPDQAGPLPWLTWAQIAEIEDSGVMTFESHTARHDRVFVGPAVVDFFHPTFDVNPLRLDTPWMGEGSAYTPRQPWGAPVHVHAPRMAGRRRFHDDGRVRQTCVNFVRDQGGESFFQRSDWRHRLSACHREAAASDPAGRWETAEEQRIAMAEDLALARQLLATRLRRPARHLCYPWGAGSALAVELSREAGYESNFWVVHEKHNINRPGQSPYAVARLKDDYIARLPGDGRTPLAGIFLKKFRRRTRQVDIY